MYAGQYMLKQFSTLSSKSTGCRTLCSVLPRLQGITTLENLRIYEQLQWLKRWGFSCHKKLQHGFLIVVLFDLLVVMDKFNASDVPKEVTVYEAIDKEARYTQKVRRVAEFCRTEKMEDIDDPLYSGLQ